MLNGVGRKVVVEGGLPIGEVISLSGGTHCGSGCGNTRSMLLTSQPGSIVGSAFRRHGSEKRASTGTKLARVLTGIGGSQKQTQLQCRNDRQRYSRKLGEEEE